MDSHNFPTKSRSEKENSARDITEQIRTQVEKLLRLHQETGSTFFCQYFFAQFFFPVKLVNS